VRRRVLLGCECSGRVRDEFAKLGWEAWSADLLPSESPVSHLHTPDGAHGISVFAPSLTHHYQGDVRDLFDWNHPVNRQRQRDVSNAFAASGEPAAIVLWDMAILFPPCFTAGTPVITARGVLPIEKVGVGDRVLTHKGRWRLVTGRMTREAPVITDGQITATPEHLFWARDKLPARYGPGDARGGGQVLPFELAPPGWAAASGTHGAYLAIPASAEELPVPGLAGTVKTAALWYMTGRWLGDGWTRITDGHNDTIICCARSEASSLEASLAETGLRWRRSEERTVTRFTLSDKHLCGWLEGNFGKYAHGKTIPGWLFGAPPGVRESVLSGYLDADGCRQAGASPSVISSVSSVSRELAVGVRVLATTLGYTTTLTKGNRAGRTTIEGRAVIQRDPWTVVIRKDDGRFTRSDGMHRWVKQRRHWRDAGVQTVYDITVDEDHSFTAHGFAVHNCTHLSQAGAVWWKHKDSTRGGDGRMQQGAAFFMEMTEAPSPLVAVENPVGVMCRKPDPENGRHVGYRPPDQVVEPWWFGDPLRKKTCLWLKGLPPLVADMPVEPTGRVATGGGSWRTDQRHGRGANNGHEDGAGRKNRQRERNRTLPGLARAMAQQWTRFYEEQAA
jgi:LAGLIDADG-like domain/Hint domain